MDGNLEKLVPTETRRLTRLALTGIALAAIVALAPHLARAPDPPYMMVHELPAGDWTGSEVRLNGIIQPGTIFAPPLDPGYLSFVIGRNGKRVRVFAFDLPMPRLYDRSELVVTGRFVTLAEILPAAMRYWVPLDGDLFLVATAFHTKCAASYDTPRRLDTTF